MKRQFIFLIMLSEIIFSQSKIVYGNFASGEISTAGQLKLISSVGENFNENQYSASYIIKNGFSAIFGPLITPAVEYIDFEVIQEFNLLQNYPNPFNPSTTIEFHIAQQGFVSLKMYDISGKEVGLLINEELPVGKYYYEWNSSDLASGIYFYRLQAKDFIRTKKLILLK